jgi:hypothetical protein
MLVSLCCAVLCCAVLCCAVLCCAVLRTTALELLNSLSLPPPRPIHEQAQQLLNRMAWPDRLLNPLGNELTKARKGSAMLRQAFSSAASSAARLLRRGEGQAGGPRTSPSAMFFAVSPASAMEPQARTSGGSLPPPRLSQTATGGPEGGALSEMELQQRAGSGNSTLSAGRLHAVRALALKGHGSDSAMTIPEESVAGALASWLISTTQRCSCTWQAACFTESPVMFGDP